RPGLGQNRGPPLDDDAPSYTRKPVRAEANTLAMSIAEFCRLHGISEDMFYKMKRDGWGPATMKVGSRTLISVESAAAWRREREATRGGPAPRGGAKTKRDRRRKAAAG